MEARRLTQCKNASDFWSLVKNLNGNKFMIHRALTPGVLYQHFKDLLNPLSSNLRIAYAEPRNENLLLDAPITQEEIINTLKTLKDGKAAGSDGIPVEFYKYGTAELIIKLNLSFNQILEHGTIPQGFKESLIFPIHKKGSTENPDNYRGISFLNASYKIFTTILQQRLNTWINQNGLLKEVQAGFRSGYSTVDHIFVLKSIGEYFLLNNKKLYSFFIDFKAAFDAVDRRALIYKLYGLGMSTKFGNVLQNLYKETKAAVWNGEETTEWFETKSGVRQGCSLSPLLFALFIDDLTDCISGGVQFAGATIKALFYADDIVLLSTSPRSLQLMINQLYRYCSNWNLQVNLNKSKIVIFRNGGGRNSLNERWFYNSIPIEVVNEFRYLGVCFTKNLSMEKHLSEKLVKAKSAIAATWKKCFANRSIAHSCKFRVFEAVSKSIIFYASQVWGYKQYESVEKLLRFFIKRIFHLPSNTPNYVVMLETGLSPLFVQTLKTQVDYIIKVLNMNSKRLPKKTALYVINRRCSWYAEWNDLAQWCGMELNLQVEHLNEWRAKLYNLIAMVDEKLREKFIEDATSSVHRVVYSRLCHNLGPRNYFKDENSVVHIAMMVRLRAELLQLNYMPHREDLPGRCSMCNLSEREDIIHFLGKCPVLIETRRSFFGRNYMTDTEVIAYLNKMEVQKLFMYCKVAQAYRNRVLSENF